MTGYRFWNWDVVDSKASIDIAMDYLDSRADEHIRYTEVQDVEVEYDELFEEIVDIADPQGVDRYVFHEGEATEPGRSPREIDVVDIPAGIYLLGDEERVEEAEKILRSENPFRTRKKLERRKKIDHALELFGFSSS